VIYNFIYTFFLCFLLASCTSEKNKELKNMDDITPKASSTKNNSLPAVTSKDSSLISYFSSFNTWEIDSVHELDSKFVPDRFSPIKSKKVIVYSSSDSTHFLSWKYKDTIDAKRSFYNFLDCVEKPCRPIQLFEEKKIASTNIVIFKDETTLICLKSSKKINVKDWLVFFNSNKTSMGFDIIIEQVKNGKTNWYSSIKEKYKPLTK
jgi:hypothetical protein